MNSERSRSIATIGPTVYLGDVALGLPPEDLNGWVAWSAFQRGRSWRVGVVRPV